jgi:hypothetical protein
LLQMCGELSRYGSAPANQSLLTLEPGKGLEVQVHHLISLGGWNDVISIYLSVWDIGVSVWTRVPVSM